MRRAPKDTGRRRRLSFRVSPAWRDAVRLWCDERELPEAELFRQATTAAFGCCPGSLRDDTFRPSRPPAAREVSPANVTWDMPDADLERFRSQAASFGVEPAKALVLIVDAYIGRPWEILRRLEALESAASLVGHKDLVRYLGRARSRLTENYSSLANPK